MKVKNRILCVATVVYNMPKAMAHLQQTLSKCDKLDHFQKWCKVNLVTQDNDTDGKLFVGTFTKDFKTEIKENECFVTLDIQGTKV